MAKHEYDKILTRLTNILSLLNDGKSLSTKELAIEFNVQDRTILRDMKRLSSFPIYKDKRKWKMQDGYKLEKTNSYEDELVLDILEKFADSIGGKLATKSHDLLNKLKNDDINPIYTKLNIEDIGDKFDEIKIIENAIANKNIIKCIYDNEVDKPMQEIVKPHLVALDENEYVRKLYLKQVSSITILNDKFESSTKIQEMLENSVSIWFQSDRESFDVHLYVDASIAKYFKRKPLTTQKLLGVNQDGSLEICVSITYEMEIIPIVKYWMPYLRVLEPRWLNDMLADDVKKFLDNIDL